jgi:biopolymer transport protein ExbB/biopolymer transport protein TolQ
MSLTDQLLKVALLGSTWVMYLLLSLSVLSFAAILERWYFFARYGKPGEVLRADLSKALLADDLDAARRVLEGDRSIVARVLGEALRWRAGGAEAIADVVESELGRARPELERGLNLLGTLGNNAPFVGLFGTVLGVIEAFHQLGAQGNKAAAMGNVMSGISEALVATGVGIFVALPAVVAYNVAQKRIGEIETSVQSLAKLLTAYVKTKERAPNASLLRDQTGRAKPAVDRAGDDLDVARAVPAGGE